MNYVIYYCRAGHKVNYDVHGKGKVDMYRFSSVSHFHGVRKVINVTGYGLCDSALSACDTRSGYLT